MQRVLVLSPHAPSRALLSRLLAGPGLSIVALGDADQALEAVARGGQAVVVVDARRPDEDAPLLLGLLRRRHPHQAVITLVPGRLRVFDGRAERVQDVQDGSEEALQRLLAELQRALQELLAGHLLHVLRPPVGQA